MEVVGGLVTPSYLTLSRDGERLSPCNPRHNGIALFQIDAAIGACPVAVGAAPASAQNFRLAPTYAERPMPGTL